MRSKDVLLCCAAILAVVSATEAAAQATHPGSVAESGNRQSATVGQTADGSTLEEIVVVAQRRSQDLQKVPIAITTASAERLAASGVSGIQGLSAAVPSVTFTQVQRSLVPFIRGIGTQGASPGDEGSVGIYVDGVYLPDAYGNNLEFNNIKQVEVLKGPQGTLFGRNAAGGLIHIITRDPQVDPIVKATLEYGSFQKAHGAFYASAGTGNVAIDFSANGTYQGKGYGEYIYAGGDVNRQRDFGLRSKLLWTPTENDRITLSADFSRSTTDIGLQRAPFNGAVLTGGYTNPGTVYDSLANYKTNNNYNLNWGGSGKYERDLGEVKISLLVAHHSETANYNWDLDAGPSNIVIFIPMHEHTVNTQVEGLVTGDVGRLKFTSGIFIYFADSLYDISRTFYVAPNSQRNFSTMRTTSYAAFTEAVYALTDNTNITLGGRITHDKRDYYAADIALPGNSRPVGIYFQRRDSRTYTVPTWNAVIDHQFAPDVMAYAKFSRGFKSGIFSMSSSGAPPVDPEKLTAYEVGLKSELFDRTVRFNLAAFHYDYKNLQVASITPAGTLLLSNAAASRINGFEAELVVAPRISTGNLQFNGSLGILDAKYSSFPNAPVTSPLPGGGIATGRGDATGNYLTRAPKWTLSLAMNYTVPLGNGEAGLNLSYYHSDGWYSDPDNRLRQQPYDLVNGEISYAFGPEQRYRLRVFGRNLTDQIYFGQLSEQLYGYQATANPPRTFGVGLDVQFGK